MTANGGTTTEEPKRKANGSFLKPGGHQNMQRSPRPRLCTPITIRNDWPESKPNDNLIGNEDTDLSNRCITSLAGSGPPSTGFCSMTDSERVVEELHVRNCKNPNVALVSYPHNARQPQKNQLTIESRCNGLSKEIVARIEEQFPFRLIKGLNGIDFDLYGLKSLSRKNVNHHSLKVLANTSNVDTTITSCNAYLISSTVQNTSATNNFSQPIVKQPLKGKGVICKDLDLSISPGQVHVNPKDDKPSFAAKFKSAILPRSTPNDNTPSLQGIVKYGTECFSDGLNLREWLKSAGHKMNKSGSLHIFNQILELVDFAHSQGVVLEDLRPSNFTLLPSSKIKYIGSSRQQGLDKALTCNMTRKRPPEQDIYACQSLSTKHHKSCIHGCRTTRVNQSDSCTSGPVEPSSEESLCQNGLSCQHTSTKEKQFVSVTMQLEEKWYCSPEELSDGVCTFSSNVYSLGVLLFELLCNMESWEVHSSVMSDLGHRILPPRFLSENPKEAGFCLWLLHPEPASRPSTRMILESEFIHESEESNSGDGVAVSDDDQAETEELLHFLILLKEEKQKQAAKLVEELSCLDEDIQEVERSYLFGTDSTFPLAQMDYPSSSDVCKSIPRSCVNEARFMNDITQLENSYFSMRSQVQLKEASAFASRHNDELESSWRLPHLENVSKEPRRIQSSVGCLGSFFEGLCKFVRYSKFEECGTLRNRDLLSSSNVICALSFDRDEDYVAAGGVSKKIKIFDFSTILSDSIGIQYPVVEMSNKSKLSCVCWNSYIKNHLASTDYDGVVQMWDAGTGQPLSQYMEHQKRAWSVHFSVSDPKMFVSGSDDCSVKLWNISERNSIGTIWSPANVCCVQFSAYSSHLLFFGSADYKVYGYDLRHSRIPWCTLAGHGKAVSYVKFVDAETVVSASTDNSLKLWNLNKTCSSGVSSDACGLTFKGHSNEKNFVGLSVLDGYIACGSETNEVYCYHKSLPVPITAYKFESTDPISGHSNSEDNNGQFVSSVCWRKKSKMLVAANSIGIVKLLQMV